MALATELKAHAAALQLVKEGGADPHHRGIDGESPLGLLRKAGLDALACDLEANCVKMAVDAEAAEDADADADAEACREALTALPTDDLGCLEDVGSTPFRGEPADVAGSDDDEEEVAKRFVAEEEEGDGSGAEDY